MDPEHRGSTPSAIGGLLAPEQELSDLLAQKEVALREMQHRHANGLQIVASLLSIKATKAASGPHQDDLLQVHERVMSLATVQHTLGSSEAIGLVELAPYLFRLCAAQSVSVMGDRQPVALNVATNAGYVSCAQAAAMGRIVAELVTNANKHAFFRDPAGKVNVLYELWGSNWVLTVSDNGASNAASRTIGADGGQGQGIVEGLATQLGARVVTRVDVSGRTVSITHCTAGSSSHWPQADNARQQSRLALQEEHLLRCLGAAVVLRWDQWSYDVQKEVFDVAGSVGPLADATALRSRIGHFLDT